MGKTNRRNSKTGDQDKWTIPSFSKIWNSIYFRVSVLISAFYLTCHIFESVLGNLENDEFSKFLALAISIPNLILIFVLGAWCAPPNVKNKTDDSYYCFTGLIMLIFGSFTDVLVMLEYGGLVSGKFAEYFKKGEPYLHSSYGLVICSIDALVYFPMHVYFLIMTVQEKSYRRLGLYWFGAIMNAMIVLVTGALHYGPTFCTAINAFWVLFPMYIFVKCWNETPSYEVNVFNTKSIWRRFTDLFFVIFLLAYIVLAAIRLGASNDSQASLAVAYRNNFDVTMVLSDPTIFIPIQMNNNYYYGIPVCVLIICGLIGRGYQRLADISLLFAGAAFQSQVSHMVVQTHKLTPDEFRIDLFNTETSTIYHWVIGLGLLLIPQLIAARFNPITSMNKKQKSS